MKFSRLISMDVDTDIYDDVTDDTYPALVGPVRMTSTGRKFFALLLDCDVDLHGETPLSGCFAYVHIDDTVGVIWKQRKALLNKFANWSAGYVDADTYSALFAE